MNRCGDEVGNSVGKAARQEDQLSEVGEIPLDWDSIAVSDLVDPTAPIRYGVVQVGQDTNGGVPIVAIKYVKEIARAPLHRASATVEEPYSRSRVTSGDILISIKGTIGRVGIVPDGFSGNISRELARLRPRQGFSGDYIGHQLESEAAQARISRAVVGTTRLEFSIAALRRFEIAVPQSLTEQGAIATTLSDADALLFGLEQLIAKKRDLKRAAMQQLLTGQIRLPGFWGEWKMKKLAHAGDCLRGVSYQGNRDLSTHDQANTKRLLRSNNVQNATIVIDDVQFVNGARVSSPQILKNSDILICMANGSKSLVGKAGYFAVEDGFEYTFGAFMGCFRTNPEAASSGYVFYLFQTGRYRDYINNLLAGSSINNLRPSSIESLEFDCPELDEQRAIADVLSNMDAELAALEARRDKTRALKQAMMQELLTGRTRLVPTGAADA